MRRASTDSEDHVLSCDSNWSPRMDDSQREPNASVRSRTLIRNAGVLSRSGVPRSTHSMQGDPPLNGMNEPPSEPASVERSHGTLEAPVAA